MSAPLESHPGGRWGDARHGGLHIWHLQGRRWALWVSAGQGIGPPRRSGLVLALAACS